MFSNFRKTNFDLESQTTYFKFVENLNFFCFVMSLPNKNIFDLSMFKVFTLKKTIKTEMQGEIGQLYFTLSNKISNRLQIQGCENA